MPSSPGVSVTMMMIKIIAHRAVFTGSSVAKGHGRVNDMHPVNGGIYFDGDRHGSDFFRMPIRLDSESRAANCQLLCSSRRMQLQSGLRYMWQTRLLANADPPTSPDNCRVTLAS